MATSTSAQKSARVAEHRRARNRTVKSAVKTQITKALRFISSRDLGRAKEAVTAAISALDKAAQKGVIHPNNAARHKSRLVHRLNQALAADTESAPE